MPETDLKTGSGLNVPASQHWSSVVVVIAVGHGQYCGVVAPPCVGSGYCHSATKVKKKNVVLIQDRTYFVIFSLGGAAGSATLVVVVLGRGGGLRGPKVCDVGGGRRHRCNTVPVPSSLVASSEGDCYGGGLKIRKKKNVNC